MQVISVTFPVLSVISVAVTAKHVDSATLTDVSADLDVINGEVIGTTAGEKTTKLAATKAAIKLALETVGVVVPVDATFADYADLVATLNL